MDIHNLMEDLVKATVNELFDAEERGASGSWCTCKQCRMDVACYVLNRIRPEYVVSSRGIAYTEHDYGEKLQKTADVVSLAREGWSRINAAKRPNHEHSGPLGTDVGAQEALVGPVFNLPPIMGRVFNVANFEPISGATVTLTEDGRRLPMMDANWQNPYSIVKNTAGTFIFWPFPVKAGDSSESRKFSLALTIAMPGFEELNHYFELELGAEALSQKQFSMQAVYRLPDLYVFPS